MAKPSVKRDDVVSLLNDLIQVCRDGEKGFMDAANQMENASTRAFLSEESRIRGRYADQLRQEVSQLGGKPETEGSTTGTIRRAWMDLKSSFGGGDKAILASCEASEDITVEAFRKALGRLLPDPIQGVLSQQFEAIERSHERVRALRDSA
jgi:uncharacterized protein (TIGR02284 family)